MAWNNADQEDRAVSFKLRKGIQEDEVESLKEAGRGLEGGGPRALQVQGESATMALGRGQ